MFADESAPAQRAFLIGIYMKSSEKNVCGDHLDELELLADTLGVGVVDKSHCYLRKYDSSTYITKGKVEELVASAHDLEADLIILDDEVLPGQQRNLEEKFGCPVIDRTELILEVFAKRAHTKEAQLQIELAKTRYQYPRLKNLWEHLDRQRGGGLFLKGDGEKQIEIDRSLLKKKISKLKNDLKEVRQHRETQHVSRERSEIPTFAIIGYTNAGKSTLLNALTDADVFVEDKLFATLDTTTRRYTLPNHQDILLIDTVGFIRKLPHTLVEAFRSTLEEATDADVLINLVDVSDHLADEHIVATRAVLKELGADEKPMITVLNKIDLCHDNERANYMRLRYKNTVVVSALKHEGFDDLMEAISQELRSRRKIVNVRIPQSDYHVVTEIISGGKILSQEYDENDVVIQADIPTNLAGKISKYIVK
ncbi:MAG: GTPase HflX [Waddliaceae bacterium]|nr:GTPase HflX [Waddliaceae bacterium]MBT3578487.1 GTPase HflX [Waddliaceae bacterium]MBT4444933.1 GTPase HflX [Waddliaceae bacterium]MBT6927976.1 GTPase HflX [Waddliaceae bacterium]MBT7263908.1 GTPase HflX [Waddliaceae bacterium]